MRHRPFRTYLLHLLAVAGGSLLLIAGVNGLINPFNLYEGVRVRGLNDYKYRLVKFQRLSKPAEVMRIQPECVMLGTSRVQTSLDPGHPGWQGCRTYNLALNNAGIYESLRYYQHAAAIHPLRRVVLELEQIYGRRTQTGFSESRLAVNEDGSPNPAWKPTYLRDVLTGLISWEGLRTSGKTVFPTYQRRPRGPEDGFWEYTPVDLKMLRHGQDALFRQVEREAFGSDRNAGPKSFAQAPVVVPREADSHVDGYQFLRAMLADTYRRGTRVDLVILPSHARLWNRFLTYGAWSDFEARKRLWVMINEDEARRAGREPFPLWDFSGFNSYTTEPVPPPGDLVTRMRWYWEAQHFNQALGDRVLDRVLGTPGAERPVARDFGVRLTSRNIERHLAAVRAAGDRWRATQSR